VDILVFDIGPQRYALPITDVIRIVHAVAITPLPKAPPAVEGVVNVRGRLVPVFDIRRRFRLASTPIALSDHLILAQAGERLVGLRADRATEVAHVEPASIESASAVVQGTQYVAGIAKLPDGVALIHDLATFLSEAEAESLDEALATSGPTPPRV
jgi:purine-binding chemotaxis protein CheW